MKHLFKVTVEWKYKGDIEPPNDSVLNVVAESAEKALKAAIKQHREGFVEKLDFVRLAEIVRLHTIDVIGD